MLKRSKLGKEINKEYTKKVNESNITAKQYYEDYKQKLLRSADIKFYDKDLEKLFK